MNPTSVQVTQYQCGLCKHLHAEEKRAEGCCTCDKCGKREGIKVTAYDKLCRVCRRADKLRKTRADLKLAQKHLDDFVESSKDRIEYFKQAVDRAAREYDAARVKSEEKDEKEFQGVRM